MQNVKLPTLPVILLALLLLGATTVPVATKYEGLFEVKVKVSNVFEGQVTVKGDKAEPAHLDEEKTE